MRVFFLVVAVMAGSLVAENVAQAKKKKKKAPVSPFAQQVTALQASQALLKQADHDYKGHRVKAMHQIHHAIHVLQYGAKKAKNPFKAPSGTGNLPQDQSDALLKKAQGQVSAIQANLSSVQDPRAAKAVVHLQESLKQLDTALKIR
jgi:hypothetical protein